MKWEMGLLNNGVCIYIYIVRGERAQIDVGNYLGYIKRKLC